MIIQKKEEWYRLKHDAVAKQFSGGLTYVNTFNIGTEYQPNAIYRAANPDREKGHKDFMLLIIYAEDKSGLVRGLDRAALAPHAIRDAIHCMKCDEVVWSCMRHDCSYCKCGNVMVDGGNDYTRCSIDDGFTARHGKVNLLTDEFTESKEE